LPPIASTTSGKTDKQELLSQTHQIKIFEGLSVQPLLGYPRWDMKTSYAPGEDKFLAASRAKYKKDPLIPQTLTAYAGFQFLALAVKKAGSFDGDKVRDAASSLDLPVSPAASGFGLKFNDQMLNTRAVPTSAQHPVDEGQNMLGRDETRALELPGCTRVPGTP
jgi:hypothetical protein